MAWEVLSSRRAAPPGGVMIASSAGRTRMPPLLTVTLRMDQLPGVRFARPGGTCQVLFGRGEQAGRMRLQPGEGARFFTLGRGKAGRSVSVRLRMPAGVKPAKRSPAVVAHDILADGTLEIRLPDWATPIEQVTPKPAYVGVTERVPDPDALLRGARR